MVGYLLYSYFFYTCCAPEKDAGQDFGTIDESFKDPDLTYTKREFSSMCSTPDGEGSCNFNTYLYLSGKLVIETCYGSTDSATVTEKQLSKNQVEKIILAIKNSDVLNKECQHGKAYDYSATYYLNVDGVKKIFEFPECESELREIDTLINAAR
ncbi:MAG: hypothetical protein UX36_C0008G0005 [Microgenomates group bacterium GW2011_GWC1_46_15]|nr:MAG: hypothetical protein UX36_C0008G0005 [Microgenomates group bacterium GW2011_GWC1_46_15]